MKWRRGGRIHRGLGTMGRRGWPSIVGVKIIYLSITYTWTIGRRITLPLFVWIASFLSSRWWPFWVYLLGGGLMVEYLTYLYLQNLTNKTWQTKPDKQNLTTWSYNGMAISYGSNNLIGQSVRLWIRKHGFESRYSPHPIVDQALSPPMK